MPSDVEEIARALNAWMTANDHVGAVVVGNSMGCQVAAELAIRHPGSACGLVLVGPTLDPFARSPLQLLARSARVALNEPIPLHAIWLRDLMRAGLRGATRALRSSVVHHIDERLEHVPIPTLIVRGEKDRLVSQRWAEAATRMLPAGELFVVMGAGHAAHYSRPSEVAEAIVSFLARHRLAPGLRQPI
jgi:pimeloyl-ACP methyl ester carboxylesterase